jgi:hypothetical protein
VRVSESDYYRFLRTGDRSILAEPNLNPDLPQSTPEHYRRSGEGHEDTSPQDSSGIVNIRASDVVVTTDRTSLRRLIQLNGVHNKPAVRQLYNTLVQNRLAFLLNPGTVIYIQNYGSDGIDTVLIRGSDREYYINHQDVAEAHSLDLLEAG